MHPKSFPGPGACADPAGTDQDGSVAAQQLPPSSALGGLGVPHLRRLWSSAMAARYGHAGQRAGESLLDRLVLDALGLGLHQTWDYLLREAPAFEAFEAWIVATAGRPDERSVRRLRTLIADAPRMRAVDGWLEAIETAPPVLDAADLEQWAEHGYVVLADAITPEEREAAAEAILRHVGAMPDEPESWYRYGGRHGIMVALIQHTALDAVRRSPRVHKAFAQLWGTADLWASADRCGFHPPQCPGYPFPGPDLHWDMDFGEPLRFGTQGILYLTDTPANQGALTVVPGFHRRLPDWLAALAPGVDPQQQDLHALGPRPIAGKAGDLVIWHQWLPHGASPNAGMHPRIVQYVNLMAGAAAVPRSADAGAGSVVPIECSTT